MGIGVKRIDFMSLTRPETHLVTQQCCTAGRDSHSAIDQT